MRFSTLLGGLLHAASFETEPKHQLLDDLQNLTQIAMATISDKMQDPDAAIELAKPFRDIALTMEKLSKVVRLIVNVEKEYNLEPLPPRPKKEKIFTELAYRKAREAGQKRDLELNDLRKSNNSRPSSRLWTKETQHDETLDIDEADP